jgi:hypothetical protein
MADNIQQQVIDQTGVDDKTFAAWVKKASFGDLEDARQEYIRLDNEAFYYEEKKLARAYSRRAHACKLQIIALQNKRVVSEQQ